MKLHPVEMTGHQVRERILNMQNNIGIMRQYDGWLARIRLGERMFGIAFFAGPIINANQLIMSLIQNFVVQQTDTGAFQHLR